MLLASAALALHTSVPALSSRAPSLTTYTANSSWGCPVRASTTVLVYNETGAGGTGKFSGQWETAFWTEWAASDGRVQWQAIDAAGVRKCAVADLSSVNIWVQPGGNAYGYSRLQELVLFSPHLEAHEGIGGVAITSAQRAANYELRRAFIAPHLRG